MLAKPMTAGSNALAATVYSNWRIGIYLRISQEDKRAGESVSITNQRALAADYVKRSEAFTGAEVFEYVDDGISGSTTDRKDYDRMMQDIDSGRINCIIVKDLSRIGRNMLETDELLMIYLVERNVRFISIGDGYDSFVQPLSVLEIATINLFNEDYLRDLVQKSVSSRYVKIKRGEHASGDPAFGYVRSKADKSKLEIDEEAANTVRLIFSLSIEGRVNREIAAILNAQDIATPSTHKGKKSKNGKRRWRTIDPDYHFWTAQAVSVILNNERYTGKLISINFQPSEQGMFKTKKRAKEDWIVVPGAHPVIVSEEVFKQAQDKKKRRRCGTAADNIFIAKVRCAVCGHVMKRSRKFEPVFKCTTKRVTNHYDCIAGAIPQEVITLAVSESLKVYTDTLIEREELKLAVLRQSKDTKATLEGNIRAEQQAVKQLESSITKIFTSMVSGEMTQEAFMSKKEVIHNSIASKNALIKDYEERLAALTTGASASENIIAKLEEFRSLEKLDRDSVDYLIDKILIHGEKDIEIVWKDRAG